MKVPTTYIAELKGEEKKKLREIMMKDKRARVRMRAHSILLSEQGYSVDTIADIYQVHRNSVSGWIKEWEGAGYESLEDSPKSGRPAILEEKEKELAIQLVAENPRSTKKVLAEIEKRTQKEISRDTLKRVIKEADYLWKRVKKS